MSQGSRLRRGLSMTEVIVSLFVVGFGVTIFGLAPSAANAIARGRHYDLAAVSASREIEAWRAVGYKSAIAGDTSAPKTLLAGVSNGTAISATRRTTPPSTLPNGTLTVALRRIDSGQFTTTTPAPASPTANYPAITGTSGNLTNVRCQIDVEVSWVGNRNDRGSVRLSSLLVEDPMPAQ